VPRLILSEAPCRSTTAMAYQHSGARTRPLSWRAAPPDPRRCRRSARGPACRHHEEGVAVGGRAGMNLQAPGARLEAPGAGARRTAAPRLEAVRVVAPRELDPGGSGSALRLREGHARDSGFAPPAVPQRVARDGAGVAVHQALGVVGLLVAPPVPVPRCRTRPDAPSRLDGRRSRGGALSSHSSRRAASRPATTGVRERRHAWRTSSSSRRRA